MDLLWAGVAGAGNFDRGRPGEHTKPVELVLQPSAFAQLRRQAANGLFDVLPGRAGLRRAFSCCVPSLRDLTFAILLILK
jgi:hypothetical protein